MAYSILYLLLLFPIFPFLGVAQTQGNISVGATISATANASDSWLSPSGDFAFGFWETENNQFLLSIWYDKIPSKTMAWYPVEGNFVESGSKVQLTADKGLVLTSPTGDELWKSQPLSGTVSFAHMNDTGNFIIKGQNSLNLWETFDHPRDTILPFQTIERTGYLQSRKSERDFSPGRFRLTLLENGNLVLSSVSLPTTYLDESYYEIKTNDDANVSNSGVGLVFNESGYLYVLSDNGQRFMLTDKEVYSTSNFYHRATINFDGVFTLYYHPRNNTGDDTWLKLDSKPDNICLDMRANTGSGVCGYNGICTLRTDRTPTCVCPPGYSLFHPSDEYGSCKPNFMMGCEDEALQGQYHLQESENTDWPISDYALLKPFTVSQCRNSCLNDCMCAVAIFRDNQCWKKKLPLSNGRKDSQEPSLALVKVGRANSSQKNPYTPNPSQQNPYIPPKKDDKDGFIVPGSVLLGTSVLVNLIFVLAIYLGFASIYKKKKNVITPQVESNLGCFTYKELVDATGGFKEELGRGAFGIVYKGEMKTSCGEFVAVKKLDRMIHEGDKEFKAEVDVIGRTHHKNLVRLFGFCNEGTNRLLVYEYLSNGTLSDFLFQNHKPCWNQRIEIIFGIARGLAYLHGECPTQIIHCDIKPQNILLDHFHNARISDFGLAKLLNIGQSYTNTGIRGTKGYVAPEWFRNQPITVKVDVYSFGVLLLEIICCRRNVDQERYEDTSVLTDWVYDCYVEGRLGNVVDDDVDALRDWKRLERFTMVALWCIQEDMVLRPSMKKVIQMLDGVVDVNVPPCPLPFAVSNTSLTLYHS